MRIVKRSRRKGLNLLLAGATMMPFGVWLVVTGVSIRLFRFCVGGLLLAMGWYLMQMSAWR